MRNMGLVMVTGEFLENLLRPVFFGKVPPGLVILKIVPSESISYAFHVVYVSMENEGVDAVEGVIIPFRPTPVEPEPTETVH